MSQKISFFFDSKDDSFAKQDLAIFSSGFYKKAVKASTASDSKKFKIVDKNDTIFDYELYDFKRNKKYVELYEGKLNVTITSTHGTIKSKGTFSGKKSKDSLVEIQNSDVSRYCARAEELLQNFFDGRYFMTLEDLPSKQTVMSKKNAVESASGLVGEFEVALKMFDKSGKIKNVRKTFKTDEARSKWIDKIEEEGNLYEIDGFRDPE